MAKNDALIQSEVAKLKNLENQLGYLAIDHRSRPQEALSSDTENPRNLGKEHCKVILEPNEALVENEPNVKEESQTIVQVPTTEKLDAKKFDELNPKIVNSKKLTRCFADLFPQKSCQYQPRVAYHQRLHQNRQK
ncbi:hypothetical protein EPI10_031409 [Gossypium australe]|uniref:Uncharacterized protein n=1 Tax=Gossypium australe TaxID=47621 RepID=A0A5B6X2Q5_9ROSI|nr:hypothetical protein EPI10_031409 [Gossypium australe]